MTHYSNGWVCDQSSSSCLAARCIDFLTIDDPDRRDRRRPDSFQLDPLRDQRAGYENRALVRLFLIVGGLIDRLTTERGASEQASRGKTCYEDRKLRSHAEHYDHRAAAQSGSDPRLDSECRRHAGIKSG